MITKRSKVYVPYLYIRINCKSITIWIKKEWGAYIIVSKGNLHFKYVSKE